MRINKTKSAVKNISFGILNKILAILFPFVIKTIIIYKLGVEYLGLNSLFSSILNILNFAEIGFGTAIVFSMYKPLAEDDTESVCALLNFYRKIYRIVGIVVVGFGLLTTPFLPYLINGDHPADINLYLLYLIYLFNNVCGYFFFAYKASLLSALQRNDISSIISSIINSLGYIVQIAVLFAFKNYYAYIIITPIATIANNLVVGYITKKKYPEYTCKGKISPEQSKEIKNKVFGLMCHKVGSVVQSSIDNIAISAFLGLTILGVYNNYLYISSSIQSFITIITSSITAGIGNNIYKDSKENNYKLFINLNYLHVMIVSFCTVCLFVLYQPFMGIWDRVNDPLPTSVVILICLLFYVNNFRGACGVYREALGTWDKDKLRPLFITLVNLVGTIISAVLGSLEGIILSTIAGYLFVSYYWEVSVLYKVYFQRSKSEYFLKHLLYTAIMIISVIISYFVTNLIIGETVLSFALKVLVCVIITTIVLLLETCWTKEFKFWLTKAKSFFRRKKPSEQN